MPISRQVFATDISASMKIEPDEANWFAQDAGGKLYAVSPSVEHLTVEDPQFTKLKDGEINIHEVDEAKKAFPDIRVNRLTAPLSEVNPEQQQNLDFAFEQAGCKTEIEQATMNDQSVSKSAQEYDLSQESLWSR